MAPTADDPGSRADERHKSGWPGGALLPMGGLLLLLGFFVINASRTWWPAAGLDPSATQPQDIFRHRTPREVRLQFHWNTALVPLQHKYNYSFTRDALPPGNYWFGDEGQGCGSSEETLPPVLFGTVYAQHAIYAHQHPETCAGKKFLVFQADTPRSGIGSRVHKMSLMLAKAMREDRIMVLGGESELFTKRGDSGGIDFCLYEVRGSVSLGLSVWLLGVQVYRLVIRALSGRT
jgi:hypothetical protein